MRTLFSLRVALLAFLAASGLCAIGEAFASSGHEPEQAAEAPHFFTPFNGTAFQSLYAASHGQRLWTDEEKAHHIEATLRAADRHGLNPNDYHISRLEVLKAPRSQEERLQRDQLLTDGLMRYAHDVRVGRVDPKTVRSGRYMQRQSVDLVAVVHKAMATDDLRAYLETLPPPTFFYQGQVKALATLRQGAEWSPIPLGAKLERGVSSPRVIALRKRLAATGELGQASLEDEMFDAALDEAVRAYQTRSGLMVDGVVGAKTLAMLNIPRQERISQMIANMERQRWLPDTMGRRHVLVNVPAFELFAINDGSVGLHMKTIVGRKDRQTPVFSDRISYLDFNPTWSVPPTIASRDVLPHLRKDPGYALVHKNVHIYRDGVEIDPYSVNWHAANIHHYTLRAPPGPRNPLGTVKFMFPNPFSVYLHDTSEPEKFSKDERALSSGCVRIADPAGMANWILSEKNDWSDAKRQAILDSRKMTRVRLDTPVPVWLLYVTAWGDDEGHPVFKPDIYDMDADLMQALRISGATP